MQVEKRTPLPQFAKNCLLNPINFWPLQYWNFEWLASGKRYICETCCKTSKIKKKNSKFTKKKRILCLLLWNPLWFFVTFPKFQNYKNILNIEFTIERFYISYNTCDINNIIFKWKFANNNNFNYKLKQYFWINKKFELIYWILIETHQNLCFKTHW